MGWVTSSSNRPCSCGRAALIYQHESLGADRAITDATDRHVQAKQPDDEDGGSEAGVLAPVG